MIPDSLFTYPKGLMIPISHHLFKLLLMLVPAKSTEVWYYHCRAGLGDKARLYSEVYPVGSRHCFGFWYHMYGSTIGSLSIYIKPVSQALSVAHLAWKKGNNQGNIWRYGQVSASFAQDDFQVRSSKSRTHSILSKFVFER